jgi:hypothetical protein
MAKNGKNERNWKAKCAYLKLNWVLSYQPRFSIN